MRWLYFLVTLSVLLTPAVAEQVVERQGWDVLTFDVPGMQLLGSKDGKTTRATFAREVADGEIKITVFIKSWIKADTFETTFRDERDAVRLDGNARLRPAVEIPGAEKTLTYSSSSPYDAEILVLYTKEFRCQLTVTGPKGSKDEIESTYHQLLKSLTLKGRSVVSPLRVEP